MPKTAEAIYFITSTGTRSSLRGFELGDSQGATYSEFRQDYIHVTK